MNILGIDTSNIFGSTAVVNEAGTISEYISSDSKSYSQKLLNMIDHVLNQSSLAISDIDGLAVSNGPGSFTGLRIGLATAYGLSMALNKKIFSVSSLMTIIQSYPDVKGLICPIIDAKRGETYTVLYKKMNGTLIPLSKEMVITPDKLSAIIHEPVTFIGQDAKKFKDTFKKTLNNISFKIHYNSTNSTAASAALLGISKIKEGCFSDITCSSPNYIRRSDAEVNWDKKI